jgi:hypothetical protein
MQAKEFKEDLFDFDSQPSNFNFAGANKLRFKGSCFFYLLFIALAMIKLAFTAVKN